LMALISASSCVSCFFIWASSTPSSFWTGAGYAGTGWAGTSFLGSSLFAESPTTSLGWALLSAGLGPSFCGSSALLTSGLGASGWGCSTLTGSTLAFGDCYDIILIYNKI
jgi:hypothetical protein